MKIELDTKGYVPFHTLDIGDVFKTRTNDYLCLKIEPEGKYNAVNLLNNQLYLIGYYADVLLLKCKLVEDVDDN